MILKFDLLFDLLKFLVEEFELFKEHFCTTASLDFVFIDILLYYFDLLLCCDYFDLLGCCGGNTLLYPIFLLS